MRVDRWETSALQVLCQDFYRPESQYFQVWVDLTNVFRASEKFGGKFIKVYLKLSSSKEVNRWPCKLKYVYKNSAYCKASLASAVKDAILSVTKTV